MSTTRRQALRGLAFGGAAAGAGALLGGLAAPQISVGRPSAAQDARAFAFLLTLEQAQAALYDAALRSGTLRGDLLAYVRIVSPQERDHVALARRRAGAAARPAPAFDFRSATSSPERFSRAAIDLEEAASAAYIGQGASLTRDAMRDAARIVAVEARHAAWIRDLAGAEPAPRPADPGREPADILDELHQKGYVR